MADSVHCVHSVTKCQDCTLRLVLLIFKRKIFPHHINNGVSYHFRSVAYPINQFLLYSHGFPRGLGMVYHADHSIMGFVPL